jgi:hypothetical protein
MKKLKVKIVRLGELPFDLNYNRIKNFKSSIFEIDEDIPKLKLEDARYSGDFCTYEIDELEGQIPDKYLSYDINFVLAITNCLLKDDYYARRLADKKAIFTFRNTRSHLENAHIPLENAIFRILYEYCLMFDEREKNNCIRKINSWFLHHETRKCLFDFDGVIEDIIISFNQPSICKGCKQKLEDFGISEDVIRKVKRELKRLRKPLFYIVLDGVKKYPKLSMILSIMGMIGINIFSSWLPHLISRLYHFICKLCK